MVDSLFNHFLIQLLFNCPLLYQCLRVLLRQRLHASDYFVHFWLGKSWLIHFVVAVFSKAYHVNHDILSEFLPISDCKLADFRNTFDVMSVNPDNRDSIRFYNIACVWERSAILAVSGEPHLIIGYEMNSSIA